MTDAPQPEKPLSRIEQFRELVRERNRKKQERRKNMLDNRYPDVTESQESEAERHERIYNDDSAWKQI